MVIFIQLILFIIGYLFPIETSLSAQKEHWQVEHPTTTLSPAPETASSKGKEREERQASPAKDAAPGETRATGQAAPSLLLQSTAAAQETMRGKGESSRSGAATVSKRQASAGFDDRQETIQWIENLNFVYNGEEIIDETLSVSSKNNIRWHLDQAPTLFRAYNYCQVREDGGQGSGQEAGSRRNVLTASFRIIYKHKEVIKIHSFDLQNIYINGWNVDDVPLPAVTHPENADIQKSFISLGRIATIDDLKQKHLIPSDTLPHAPERYSFKIKEAHTEKALLMDLARKVNDIGESLSPYQGSIIQGFILNIASLRDICTDCAPMISKEINSGEIFLNDLKRNLVGRGHTVLDDASLTVFASGMSYYGTKAHNSRTNMGFDVRDFSRRGKIIGLPNAQKRVYHTTNPQYPSINAEKKPVLNILAGW